MIVLTMRSLLVVLALAWGAMAAADGVKPPERLTFPCTRGDVPFDHAAHLKRQQGACADCHNKLFLQSAKEPLKGSQGCRNCHKAGGPAFSTQACDRCHPVAPAAAANSRP
jgi:c(7)-type cytochrome triheme protein